MVTLQLLDHQEEEQGERSSEEEEEEEPLRPSLEQPGPATPGMPPAPPSGEMQEAPEVLSEQVVGETTPLPLQALPMPEHGAQTREGEPSEAEVPSGIKDSSLPPEPAGIPAHRVLGPPTSIPPKPPGPVTMDSESEETLAGDQRTVQPSSLLGEHVREVATDGLLQGNSRRLSLTPDPEKEEPPALDLETQGGGPQSPELKQVEDISSSGPRETLLDTQQLASAAIGASLRHNQGSQHCRCVSEQAQMAVLGLT